MSHITDAQRYTISVMLEQGYSQNDIARTIKKDKSVVSREIRRNRNPRTGRYTYKAACLRSAERKKRFSLPRRFTKEIEKRIRSMLLQDWSPEQIVGYCARNGLEMVSVERIYQYIRLDKLCGGDLYKHCRHRLKKRKRQVGTTNKITDRKSIDERPPEANGKRFGDIEMDLMVGRNGQDAVLTVVDRLTGLTWIKQLPNGKDAEGVAKAMIEIMTPYKHLIKTITTDNGPEFAAHKKISEALGVDVFFAHPYHSWEKGCVEYTNKLYRQYLVKGCRFKHFSQLQLTAVQNIINNRPRKKLGFSTPLQTFSLTLRQNKKLHLILESTNI